MILIVTAKGYGYTHRSLYRERELDVAVISYADVLNRKSPHRATHIFTDFDRLASHEVHEAASHYRRLARAGIRVLNDPARFVGRFGLLRGLNRAGINQFDAYRVDGLERPSRWPVFLRLEGNHGAPVSGLLHNKQELDQALHSAIEQGAPLSALLIIEYAAEPVRDGLFRKLSIFRIGEALLGYTCVVDDNWVVKYGKVGISPPDFFEEEYSFVADNPFTDTMREVFDLAGIEYGRVDFGLVGGRPQIYEINSNPMVDLTPKEQRPARQESLRLLRANYIEAMNAIDTGRRPIWQVRSSLFIRSARTAPARAREALANTYRRLRKADAFAAAARPPEASL